MLVVTDSSLDPWPLVNVTTCLQVLELHHTLEVSPIAEGARSTPSFHPEGKLTKQLPTKWWKHTGVTWLKLGLILSPQLLPLNPARILLC